MRTSVYKNIIDRSIEGVKLVDETNLEDVGYIYSRRFYARQSGGADVIKGFSDSGIGIIQLLNDNLTGNKTRVGLDASGNTLNFFMDTIILGGNSELSIPNPTNYKTQVYTNLAVGGYSYFVGQITGKGALSVVEGHSDFKTVTTTGLLTTPSAGIKVGSHTPTDKSWESLENNSSVISSDQWTTIANNASTISTLQWAALATMQQKLKDLTEAEVDQLIKINSAVFSSDQWGYLANFGTETSVALIPLGGVGDPDVLINYTGTGAGPTVTSGTLTWFRCGNKLFVKASILIHFTIDTNHIDRISIYTDTNSILTPFKDAYVLGAAFRAMNVAAGNISANASAERISISPVYPNDSWSATTQDDTIDINLMLEVA